MVGRRWVAAQLWASEQVGRGPSTTIYKVVVGRVIAGAYTHCSLKVGVAKSFGLLLHHSSIVCGFSKY